MTTVLDRFRLDDHVALVSGGAGLLGREFCRTLAAAGATVMVVDRDANRCEDVVGALVQEGLRAEAAVTDITDPAAVSRLTERVAATHGRIDVLVNAAALDPKFDTAAIARGLTAGEFESYPLALWQQSLDVNLTGTFLLTQAVARVMRAQGEPARGSIINLCSTYGLNGPDQRLYVDADGRRLAYKPVDYSVTKAAMLGFTRYLAAYFRDTAIRVNALTPGGVYNDHDAGFTERYAARTILGRMAAKDEMNGALLFLASSASSYMTGGNLVVDGGWTAW